MKQKDKNIELVNDFVDYCELHPEMRFWQALRNWAKVNFIYVSNEPTGEGVLKDTFYWEGRNK